MTQRRRQKRRLIAAPSRLAAAGLLTFAAVLVADAPASLVWSALGAQRSGLQYDSAKGSLWSGEVRALSWRGMRVGDVGFHLRPLALFAGRLGADIDMRNGAISGRGEVSGDVFGLIRAHDIKANVDLGALRDLRLFGAPLSGEAAITLASITVSSGGCRHAEGQASTNAIETLASKFGRKAFVLKGPIRCENGVIVAPLVGGADGVNVEAIFRFGAKGAIATKVTVETQDQAAALALQTLGFHNDNGAWRLETSLGSRGGPS